MAAPNITCAVLVCDRRAKKRGWCEPHYRRWLKYSDPLGGGTLRGSAPQFVETAILTKNKKQCLIWPFSRDGYGYAKIKLGPKPKYVHRVICERIHGPPPSPHHEAAHRCGMGHTGCVNPHHIRWATAAENQRDRARHGTELFGEKHPSAKLTNGEIEAIRRAYANGQTTQRQLSIKYKIGQGQVSRIVNYTRRQR